MTAGALIRPARPEDAAAIAAIYEPYVINTAITFEYDPPDAAEIARRIATGAPVYPWLVTEGEDTVIGYAYAAPYRARAAYAWVAEAGIYLAEDARGGGVGLRLYQALCAALTEAGFVAVVAAMTLPNPASEALHARCGFRHVGTQPGIGFKFGRWYDVSFWQRDLAARIPTPAPPGRR